MAETDQHDGQRVITLEDEAHLDAFVSETPVALVEFYTDGCGICAQMEPVLDVVAKKTDAAVATVNPRDDPPLVDRFRVQSVPLFVAFVDGDPVARRAEGYVGAKGLTSLLESATA